MISGNVPKHLTVGARSGFLAAMRERSYAWQKVAQTIKMGTKSVDLVDLGAAPMPVNSKSGITVQDMIEMTMEIGVEDWDITVWLSQNAMDDDQTGSLERKVRGAGDNFNKHINKRVFEVLNAGDASTYGLGYDGQEFFCATHVDDGAHYQTAQDNEYALSLSMDNFETVYVAAQGTRDDQGQYSQHIYDLLVINPANQRIAVQITENPEAYDTASRERNPYAGEVRYIMSSYMDSTAWALIASNEVAKPILLAMRAEPHLQSAWFDPTASDGGRYYFKFFARYEVHYGNWRLALLGNT